jgi:hypothetical protein
MLRLQLSNQATSVKLSHGVTLNMRQPGQFHFDVAEQAAKEVARKLSQSAEAMLESGASALASDFDKLLPLLEAGDQAGMVGFGEHLMAVQLGLLVIDEIIGVTDQNGSAAKVTAHNLGMLFNQFIPDLPVTFGVLFLRKCRAGAALEISEGNGSAVAPNGSSVTAANTAPVAKPQVTPAAVVAKAQKANSVPAPATGAKPSKDKSLGSEPVVPSGLAE